jgi:SAM-dependent methyltransferase
VGQIVFDDDLGSELEALYRTRDIVGRRKLVRAALAARPGERILDVGCGPGFYLAELADEVGPEGALVGVDLSPQMLALAYRRLGERENVALHEGESGSLPVESGSFDAAVCVQVLEYVADVPAALAEIHRALRPGGRVLLWDVDWSTVSWHSTDPERMRHALLAWDGHLTHPALPRQLAAHLRAAGFDDVEVEGHVFATTSLDPESFGGALFPMVERFLAAREDFGAESGAWADEQRELDARGKLFFSVTQFRFLATRLG